MTSVITSRSLPPVPVPDITLVSRVHRRPQVLRLDPESAVKTYESALTVDPSLSNVWFNLANAYLKLGEEAEAARWWVS